MNKNNTRSLNNFLRPIGYEIKTLDKEKIRIRDVRPIKDVFKKCNYIDNPFYTKLNNDEYDFFGHVLNKIGFTYYSMIGSYRPTIMFEVMKALFPTQDIFYIDVSYNKLYISKNKQLLYNVLQNKNNIQSDIKNNEKNIKLENKHEINLNYINHIMNIDLNDFATALQNLNSENSRIVCPFMIPGHATCLIFEYNKEKIDCFWLDTNLYSNLEEYITDILEKILIKIINKKIGYNHQIKYQGRLIKNCDAGSLQIEGSCQLYSLKHLILILLNPKVSLSNIEIYLSYQSSNNRYSINWGYSRNNAYRTFITSIINNKLPDNKKQEIIQQYLEKTKNLIYNSLNYDIGKNILKKQISINAFLEQEKPKITSNNYEKIKEQINKGMQKDATNNEKLYLESIIQRGKKILRKKTLQKNKILIQQFSFLLFICKLSLHILPKKENIELKDYLNKVIIYIKQVCEVSS